MTYREIDEQLERLAYQVIIRLCENRLEQLDSMTVEDVMQAVGHQPEAKTQTKKPDSQPAHEPQAVEPVVKNGKHSREPISEETANRIVELYKQGVIINDIKKQLGIKNANSIYRYLHKNGIEPHRVKDITKHKEEAPTGSEQE